MILERELKKRKIKKRPFALSLPGYSQTIKAITKGKRNPTPEVSLKIDRALGLEEGAMYLLQAYSAIKEEKLKERIELHPDLSLFRKGPFWDTDMSKLDWEKQYKPITFTVQRYPVESWAEHNSIPGSTLFLIDSGYRLCRMPNSMINVLTRLDRKNRQNYLATIVDH